MNTVHRITCMRVTIYIPIVYKYFVGYIITSNIVYVVYSV